MPGRMRSFLRYCSRAENLHFQPPMSDIRDPTHICRGFTDQQWRLLRTQLVHGDALTADAAAWHCAVEVFARRIRERFLSCIETLFAADTRSDVEVGPGAPGDCSTLPRDDLGAVVPGFAIMALCCLLVETLQSFREARGAGDTGTQLFEKFLARRSFQGAFGGNVAKSFVRGIRDGILHEAETRRWAIWRDEPHGAIVETRGNGYVLNRTAFYEALRTEFEEYVKDVKDLRDQSKDELRRRFIKKMDDVASEC